MELLLSLIIKALETVVITLVNAMTTYFLSLLSKQRKKTTLTPRKRTKGGSDKIKF